MKEKKKCQECGNTLTQKAKFCPECGTPVNKEILAPVEEKEEAVVERDFSSSPPEETIIIDETLSKEEKKPKKEKNIKIRLITYPIITCICTLLLCFGAFMLFYDYYLENLVIETTKREVTITDTGISESVDKVYDSVVVVESYYKNQLFATGTGFVFKTDDNKGYILTNDHVIESADKVKVVFTNNEKVEVDIVGSDSYSDVALLSVDKEKVLKVAEIGSSEDLKVGDTSFAVGAPLDSSTYAWTVTRGVISGKNRTVTVSSSNGYNTSIMEVLQTDTAINSGNSGGPLCNSNGEVIGITNMKLASSQIEGMGFAIPIETALKYAEKFINGEKISYPYIGVSIYDATASRYSTEVIGVFVESVEDDSPADKGGLKKGDEILKVNDVEIENTTYFKHELYKYEVGDTITITIKRNDKEKELTIKLGSSNMTT